MQLKMAYSGLSIEQGWEGRRRGYRVSGQDALFPSVTTILKVIDKSDALMRWAQNSMGDRLTELLKDADYIPDAETPGRDEWITDLVQEAKRYPERLRDNAADFGSLIHAVIAGEAHPSNELEQMYLTGIERFLEDNGIKVVASEVPVWAKSYQYCGTVDSIGEDLDGRTVVLDWKTGKGLWDNYAMQLAAYARAVYEMYECKGIRAVAVRLGREGEVEYKEVNLKSAFAKFEAALGLWKELNGFGGRTRAVWY